MDLAPPLPSNHIAAIGGVDHLGPVIVGAAGNAAQGVGGAHLVVVGVVAGDIDVVAIGAGSVEIAAPDHHVPAVAQSDDLGLDGTAVGYSRHHGARAYDGITGIVLCNLHAVTTARQAAAPGHDIAAAHQTGDFAVIVR